MANTIDVDASRNSRLITDVDNHRRRLLKDSGNVQVRFISPIITTFEKYRFFLLKESEIRDLKQKYFFRPDYLSFDEYGTTVLWPLILYINDIPSLEEFNKEEILLPSFDSILEIAKFNELNSVVVDIDAQNLEPSNSQDIILYSTKVSPTLIDPDIQVNQSETDQVAYIRQKFTLNQTNIFNKFVDLAHVPVIESVTLKISNSTLVPIFDQHYTIIQNSNDEFRRLTWSDDENVSGSGLESELLQGSILEVQYVKDNG